MRPDLSLHVRSIIDLDRARSPVETAVASLALHEPEALDALVRQMQQHAGRDELTGAWERTPGLDQLRRAVDRAHRTLEPLVVVFADLDHLKGINDGAGHAAGDHALRSAGMALLGTLRSYDLVLRYGGDEFVCALPHIGAAQAENRMQHVAAVLRAACPGTSLSSGFAVLQPGQSADDVVRTADQDMYARRGTARAVDRAELPREPAPDAPAA